MFVLQPLIDCSPVTVVTGHYGVGKTNLALNMALDAQAAGYEVALIDMDVVNPYFRSSEYADALESQGIRVISPVFARAGSSLDTPSLSPAMGPAIMGAQADFAIGGKRRVIIDVGGDDAGATACGRFAETITSSDYRLVYVVNKYRNLTQDPAEALEILREIESASGLRVTAVVNNSHMKGETTLSTVAKSVEYAETVARAVQVPLAATTVPAQLAKGEGDALGADELPEELADITVYPVKTIVKTPWE